MYIPATRGGGSDAVFFTATGGGCGYNLSATICNIIFYSLHIFHTCVCIELYICQVIV